MQKLEFSAFSLEDAKQQALALGVNVVKNVTPSYKKENPSDIDEFGAEMLKKNRIKEDSKDGVIIVVESGMADTRERPYTFINNTVEGQLTKKRVFEIRKVSDDSLVAEAETKGDAARVAKAIMKSVKEDLVCKQVYRVLGKKAVAFELNYTPSSRTKEGKYIVFSL